jgi:threonine dehydratase
VSLTLDTIEETLQRIRPHIVDTPIHHWTGPGARALFGPDADVWLKLELFQVTGSFKPRGALNVALQLSPDARRRGFTTFSSGNHAAAVAYAAQVLGTTAKVVMLQSANEARIQNCRRYGGEIVLAPAGPRALDMVKEIEVREGRTMIHPYEGPLTSAGAATLGYQLSRQIPNLDAVIVAIGGGGLCSGVGPAIKLAQPRCEVWAIEPEGADSMFRSFASGKPERLDSVSTIADSLAPPHALPYSFKLCRESVSELSLISDREMVVAMRHLFEELKLIVEPGGAAAMAGALGPFRHKLAGKRVAIVVCGSNIDLASFKTHIGLLESC